MRTSYVSNIFVKLVNGFNNYRIHKQCFLTYSDVILQSTSIKALQTSIANSEMVDFEFLNR